MISMKWDIKSFNELSTEELYQILDLRNRVFVVEQNCVYLDTDGKDFNSKHLLCRDQNGILSGYARILPPDLAFENLSSIGRVVNNPDHRRKGLGKLIMEKAIEHCFILYPHHSIMIEAQSYLIPFYGSLGFEPLGSDYILDGIPHREMVLLKKKL